MKKQNLNNEAKNFLHVFETEYSGKLGKRATTFREILGQLLELKDKDLLIVETGTTRNEGNWEGDGQSTILFDKLVNMVGGQVISIDIDPEACRISERLTSDKTTVICGDSVKTLYNLERWTVDEVDLLYLDSFDVNLQDDTLSAVHHLMEFSAASRRLRNPCVLAIDDTLMRVHGYFEKGQFKIHRKIKQSGKGRLLSQFFSAIELNPFIQGYQEAYVLKGHRFNLAQSAADHNKQDVDILDFSNLGHLPLASFTNFSHVESEGRWAMGPEARLTYHPLIKNFDLIVINARVYVTDDHSQRILISLNGNPAIESKADKSNAIQEIMIPLESEIDDQFVLDFSFPDAVSPLSIGKSGEKRILGLMIRQISLRKNPAAPE